MTLNRLHNNNTAHMLPQPATGKANPCFDLIGSYLVCMQLRVFAIWCAACLLWSSTFLFVRLGVTTIPPLTFAWTRLLLALAILGPLALTRGWFHGLTRRDVALIGATGVLILGVNYALLFWGAQFIPSGLVAILQSATPVVGLTIGWLLGSEQISARKLAALGTCVLGVLVIFGDAASVSRDTGMAASVAVFLGSCSLALGYVALKTYGRQLHPAPVITIQTFAAAVPLMMAALAIEGSPLGAHWSPAAVAALLYLGIVASVVAFWMNYWLLRRIDASLMLLMGVAEVPIAVALGVIFLDEPLHIRTLIGAGCIAIGVALVATPRAR
jgi:drug/metabolite transporter (DMT)-like permease